MNLFPSPEDLKRLAESQNTLEKRGIIRKLSHIPSTQVVYPILNSLTSGEQDLIQEAANALVKLNPFSNRILRTEITNRNCFIRWTIVLAVQKIDDPSFSSVLIPALGIGYSPIEKIICKILTKWHPERFPSEKLSDILKNLTATEAEQVGYYATHQLGIQALDSTETLHALEIFRILNWNNAIVPILKASYHSDYRICEKARKVIKYFPKSVIYSVCAKYLRSPELSQKYDFGLSKQNYPLKLFSIEGFGHVGLNFRDVKDIFNTLLSTGSKMEKFFVIRAFGELDREEFRDFMRKPEIQIRIKQYLNEIEGIDNIKLESIHLLGSYFPSQGGEEEWIVSFLLSFLKDENPFIRLSVLNAIYNSPIDNVLERIAFLLIDEDVLIRKATVRLFEELEPEKYLVKSSEGNIIAKLPEIIKSKILTHLTEKLETTSLEYQSFAAFWLGTLNHKPAIEILIQKLHNPSDEVRISTINALGIIRSTQAVPHLLPLIFENNSRIQRKVIETIGNIGEEGEGVKYLIQQLFKPETPHPSFLEKYINSFGAKTIPLLSTEIANEKDSQRRDNLKQFMNQIIDQFRIQSDESFDIIL